MQKKDIIYFGIIVILLAGIIFLAVNLLKTESYTKSFIASAPQLLMSAHEAYYFRQLQTFENGFYMPELVYLLGDLDTGVRISVMNNLNHDADFRFEVTPNQSVATEQLYKEIEISGINLNIKSNQTGNVIFKIKYAGKNYAGSGNYKDWPQYSVKIYANDSLYKEGTFRVFMIPESMSLIPAAPKLLSLIQRS